MDQPANKSSARFVLDVSDDCVTVTLRVSEGAAVGAAEVVAQLQAMGVKNYDEPAIVATLEKRGTAAAERVVARGLPAVDERHGKVDFRVPLVPPGIGVTITRVDASQLIAKIGTSLAGTNGRDVFGEPILPKPAVPPFAIGRSMSLAKGEVIATARGSLRLIKGTLSAEPLLEISGEGEQPVQFDGDVFIKGGLRDGRIVRVTGSLLIGGTVEAADVRADGSMQVKGGLIGKGRGQCSTGGDFSCRFVTGSILNISGNLHVQSELANAQVVCAKAIDIVHGRIYGGRVVANGGITCATVGNESNTPTLLEVGADATLEMLTAKITAEAERLRERAKSVRDKIEPLMKMMKRLTHQQRERATELMAEASETEERADELTAQLAAQIEAMRAEAKSEVTVQDVAHAGVTIRIGRHQTVLKMALKGPFTITTMKPEAVTTFVLIDGLSGKRTPLPTYDASSPTEADAPPAQLQLAA